MNLMTYNILEGGTGRTDPLAEVIRLANADVVLVQEASCADDPHALAFHKLADRLAMDRFLAENPRSKGGAVGILSRLPIREAVNHAAIDTRFARGCLHAIIDRKLPSAAGDLVIIATHLTPGELIENEQKRLAELEALFDVAKLFRGREHIIAGDFNASHPSQKIDLAKVRQKTRDRVLSQGGIFPREVIRQMLEHGYVDAHALHHAPDSFATSFTTAHPAMRVDYIFVTAGIAPHVRRCEVVKPEMGRFASDHYPVVCDLA